MNPEGNSSGIVDVGQSFAECWIPSSDVRAFTEVLSEITMGDSRVKGVSRPDVLVFIVEIIQRGLSGDSKTLTHLWRSVRL
jgi:hypothetical protein